MRGTVLHVIAALLMATPVQLIAGEDTTDTRKPPSRVVGREIAPFLKGANDAIRKQDWDLAAEQLAKADALPNKTEFERGLIDEMRKLVLFKTVSPAFQVKSSKEVLQDRANDKSKAP